MTESTIRLYWASVRDFEDDLDELTTLLPTEERERAHRLNVTAARQRFVLGRVLLRRQLGFLLGVTPAALELTVAERGKPQLAASCIPLAFNLSHSGDVVVLAVADQQVGVDVEFQRPIDLAERLSRRYFSPAETGAVLAATSTDKDRVFLRIWTQKEAWLKATGLGVGMPLREVETQPDPTLPPRLLTVSGDRDQAARWSLTEASIPGAVCIVAVAGSPPDLDVRRITSLSLDDLRT
jgi:phosphopantetheinyl transferase